MLMKGRISRAIEVQTLKSLFKKRVGKIANILVEYMSDESTLSK